MTNDFVGMIKKVCVICGEQHEEIIIDKMLRSVEKYHGNTYGEEFEKCRKMIAEGYTFLLEYDPEKTTIQPNGNVLPEDAYRTGRYVAVRQEAFKKLFNINNTSPVMFIDPEVFDKLETLFNQIEASPE